MVVTHKYLRNNIIIEEEVDPPLIEEIMDDDFDYSTYVQNFMNYDFDDDEIFKEFFSDKVVEEVDEKVPLKIQKLYDEYHNNLLNLMWQYEKGIKSIDYNQAMKDLTIKYLNDVDDYYKKQDIIETLVTDLKGVCEKKTKEEVLKKSLAEERKKQELASKQRFQSFIDGELSPVKLTPNDLRYLVGSEKKGHLLMRIRARCKGYLSKEDCDRTIEELYHEGKFKR